MCNGVNNAAGTTNANAQGNKVNTAADQTAVSSGGNSEPDLVTLLMRMAAQIPELQTVLDKKGAQLPNLQQQHFTA